MPEARSLWSPLFEQLIIRFRLVSVALAEAVGFMCRKGRAPLDAQSRCCIRRVRRASGEQVVRGVRQEEVNGEN